jgi:hypothetical protein
MVLANPTNDARSYIYTKLYIYIYGVYTVFLAGKSPNVRSIYTVLALVICKADKALINTGVFSNHSQVTNMESCDAASVPASVLASFSPKD